MKRKLVSLAAASLATVATVASVQDALAECSSPPPPPPPTYDYGDAPASYDKVGNAPALAYHLIGSLYLGNSVDNDATAQPTAAADGDDSDVEGNDDDGIGGDNYFYTGTYPDLSAYSSGAGYLNAWADWNKDGDFTDLGEQILENEPVVAGYNDLTGSVYVPETAKKGNTYFRFRLTSATGTTPNGYAATGEVEDYRIPVIGAAGAVRLVRNENGCYLLESTATQSCTLRVERVGGGLGTVSVGLRSRSGTATRLKDYQSDLATSTRVTFKDGEYSYDYEWMGKENHQYIDYTKSSIIKNSSIGVIPDRVTEADEDLDVYLADAAGGVTILDDVTEKIIITEKLKPTKGDQP